MCFGLCETLSAFSQQSPDPHAREADRQADGQTQPQGLAAEPLQDPAGKCWEMPPPPVFVGPGGWEEEEEIFLFRLRPKELCESTMIRVQSLEEVIVAPKCLKLVIRGWVLRVRGSVPLHHVLMLLMQLDTPCPWQSILRVAKPGQSLYHHAQEG